MASSIDSEFERVVVMSESVLSVVPRGYIPDLCGGLEICARITLENLIGNKREGFVAAHGPSGLTSNLLARLLRKVRGPYFTNVRIDNHCVYTDPWHPGDLNVLSQRISPTFVVCHVAGNNTSVPCVLNLQKPALFYIHGRNIHPAFKTMRNRPEIKFACESTFIQKRFENETGHNIELVRPVLDRANFVTDQSGDAILVINPHPLKGGELVVHLAREMPHRHFLIVGGWEICKHEEHVIKIEHDLASLNNVERVSNLSDIREAFRRSKCLLMPCKVEEAYGRAAAEALIAGLPVIASNRGALPETVGAGGVTLDIEQPVQDWVCQLDRLFEDNEYFADLVSAAEKQSYEKTRRTAYIKAQLNNIATQLTGFN